MSKLIMPEQFSPEAEKALYNKLVEIATPHVERSNGQLSILPPDIKEYPAQALGVFCVKGQLLPPSATDFIGSKAMPEFIAMSYGLMNGEGNEPTIKREAEKLLIARNSIVIATDHDDVTSPAYALGGFANPLRKANAYRSNQDKISFETGIIVSKMLSVLAYEFNGRAIPCMYVLNGMCDRVYLTYPRSKTFLESGIADALPPNHIGDHNNDAKTDIDIWISRGAVILGASLLGSTHKREEEGTVHKLPRVTKGSGEMVTGDNIHLVPAIVGLTEADRYMQRIGSFLQFRTWEDAHPLYEQMAAARTERNRARGSQVICIYQTAEQAEEERRQLQSR